MAFYIAHISALQYLLSHRTPQSSSAKAVSLAPTRSRPRPGSAPSVAALSALHIPDGIYTEALHLNVATNADRRRSSKVITHAWAAPARGTYLTIDDDFCVLTPEACFLQMAGYLNLPHLVELGFLLCGTYVPNCIPAIDRKDLKPLTTPQKIGRYLQRFDDKNGLRKSRVALRYVKPGSASVMESKIATLVFLGTRYGGLQAPALLNKEIALSDRARGLDWANTRKPDLFWPERNVALDYDSRQWHDERQRADHDERRRNELAAMGINSLVCRSKDFSYFSQTQQFVGQLNGALGKSRTRTTDYDIKQELLYEQLFGKHKWEVIDEVPKRRSAKHAPAPNPVPKDDAFEASN